MELRLAILSQNSRKTAHSRSISGSVKAIFEVKIHCHDHIFKGKFPFWTYVFPIKSARKGLRDIIKSKFNNIMRVILLMLRDNGRGFLICIHIPLHENPHDHS